MARGILLEEGRVVDMVEVKEGWVTQGTSGQEVVGVQGGCMVVGLMGIIIGRTPEIMFHSGVRVESVENIPKAVATGIPLRNSDHLAGLRRTLRVSQGQRGEMLHMPIWSKVVERIGPQDLALVPMNSIKGIWDQEAIFSIIQTSRGVRTPVISKVMAKGCMNPEVNMEEEAIGLRRFQRGDFSRKAVVWLNRTPIPKTKEVQPICSKGSLLEH